MTLLARLDETARALGMNIHGHGRNGGMRFGPAFRDRTIAQNCLRRTQGESGAFYHGMRRATELCRDLPTTPNSLIATNLIKALFVASPWMRQIWPVPGDSPKPRPGTHAWLLQTQLGRREDPRPSHMLTQRLQEVGDALDLTSLTCQAAKRALELEQDADVAMDDKLSKLVRAIGHHSLFGRGQRQNIPRLFMGVKDCAVSLTFIGDVEQEGGVGAVPRPK